MCRSSPLLPLLLLTCVLYGRDRDRPGPHGHDRPDRSVLHADEFESDPGLVAREGQAVLLDRFLPADISGPRARYRLKSGQHSFCLQGGDPYFTGLTLADDDGKVLFRMPRGEHCRSVRLPKGTYTLRARHSNAVPDPDKLTFLGVDEPTPPLHDANGNPLGGYWAITPLNGNDVDTGVLRPAPPPRNLGDIYSNDMPLIADFQGFQYIGGWQLSV